MLKHVAPALLLMTVALPAHASKWYRIGPDDQKTEWYVDASSKSHVHGLPVMWFSHVTSDGKEYVEQVAGHCADREIATLSLVNYAADGTVLESVSTSRAQEISWDSVVPDTAGENMFNLLCSSGIGVFKNLLRVTSPRDDTQKIREFWQKLQDAAKAQGTTETTPTQAPAETPIVTDGQAGSTPSE